MSYSSSKKHYSPNYPEHYDDTQEFVNIKELDLELIPPSTNNYKKIKQGGSKIVVIGKPGTGKSTIIASILYSKKHIIPVGIVMSGTEDSNGFYKKLFPDTFIFNNYDEKQIEKFIGRQKIAKQHLENPWAVLLIDDCTDDPALFRKPLQQSLYKFGRHWKMLYILSLQYCMDIRPAVRTNVDGCFILREPILKNRKSLYENYAGIIPSFKLFCEIMDGITDGYTALYIDNAAQTNDWKKCIYYYKAQPVPKGFKFGCHELWDFHYHRFNTEYTNPLF